MSNPPPSQPSAKSEKPRASDDQTQPEVPFDVQLREFWETNRKTIFVGCGLVLLAIIGRYTYDAYSAQREASIESGYAAALTPARLQTFARDHAGHPLAGAAWLKLADDAYVAGNFAEAVGNYDKAIAALPGTPYAARALLGKAMCQLQSGKTAEGAAILKQLSEDTAQLRGVRCEAAYHLASLAFDAGHFDEVARLANLVMQADAGGTWAQRCLLLRARAPEPVATVAVPAVPPAEKPAEGPPAVTVKVPGS
jgi:predicted negative regulator of RcsB-dependent stress response